MTLRIAIITDAWRPQINGVVTTLETTGRLLVEMGHTVKMITPDAFKTIPCPTYPSIRLAYRCKTEVFKQLDVFKPDHIHIVTEGPLGFTARKYCLQRNLAFTTSFHTLFPEYINMRLSIPVSWGYKMMRWFHSPAQQIMVPTASIERKLQGFGFKNAMVRWSRGVDTALFRPRTQSFLDLPKPVCMYVGRVAIEKNINAFLNLDLPGSKVVVGNGPQLEALKDDYPEVMFTGFQFGESLAKYMAEADVFVFPSRTDTFGIVMLDALASGVPVAAYPVPGPIDIVSDTAIGRLNEDLKQAVEEALELDQQDCRNFALHFTWEKCTEQFKNNLVSIKMKRKLSSDTSSLQK